ncbi:ankyrin repeat-containing domain protein [Astrocystis sublimbata]|nr:ankyrin repeat-containing domain protein [Astrocystis sublimbata]
MPRASTSRHMQAKGRKPPIQFYSAEAFKQFSEFPTQRNDNDDDDNNESRRADRQQRWSNQTWTQADQQEVNNAAEREEEYEELRRAPLRRELEALFSDLGLPALPPPLLKKSEWHNGIVYPHHYPNVEVRPFFAACAEGSLATVEHWVTEKRVTLSQVGVQDGLAIASRANQVSVIRYLLDKDKGGGAHLDGSVVEGACENHSLPLFQLCIQHGYHPNQQVASIDGHFGVALTHCLNIGDEEIVQLLLHHGADPDLAPFQDGRRLGWGRRAAPPVDRTCGLALDLAAKHGSLAIVKMLLEHGANPSYARPFHEVISRRWRAMGAGRDQDQRMAADGEGEGEEEEDSFSWRPFMEVLIEHGADVNALTYVSGSPLRKAVSMRMWDVVEFLLARGADPIEKMPHRRGGGDLFLLAAEGAGVDKWEPTERVGRYLRRLADLTGNVELEDGDDGKDLPEEVVRNPLVQALQRVRRGRTELARD